MKLKKNTKSSFATILLVTAAFIIVTALNSAGALSNLFQGLLVPICAYMIMALSLNLTVGVLGELSLGHAGFMSVGAFTGAVVSMSLTGTVSSALLRLVIALIAGAVVAGIFGFLIGLPVLRLKGDYLAIVTLAFGEIIRSLITCIYVGVDSRGLHFSLKSAEALGLEAGGRAIIKGPMGAVGLQKISTFTIGFIMVIITLALIFTLVDSRAGRAIMAIRDNRIAAESVGIPITKYKMMTFITSAALAGMAGVLYGLNYSTFTAVKFNYNTSILVLVFVVLGGIGNMRGSVIAAPLLLILPELLRGLNDYRMLIYAVVLIVVMIMTNNASARAAISKITDRIAVFFMKRKTTENSTTEDTSNG